MQFRIPRFDPWVGKIPWKRERLPTPVFLPGEFHGERSLVGYSPQGRKELDMTEQLTLFIFKKIKLTSSKLTAEQSLTILRKVHQNPATNSIKFTMSNVQSR